MGRHQPHLALTSRGTGIMFLLSILDNNHACGFHNPSGFKILYSSFPRPQIFAFLLTLYFINYNLLIFLF